MSESDEELQAQSVFGDLSGVKAKIHDRFLNPLDPLKCLFFYISLHILGAHILKSFPAYENIENQMKSCALCCQNSPEV